MPPTSAPNGKGPHWKGFGSFSFPKHKFSMVPIPEALWCLKPELGSYKRQKLVECFGMEGTLKIILFHCHSLDVTLGEAESGQKG